MRTKASIKLALILLGLVLVLVIISTLWFFRLPDRHRLNIRNIVLISIDTCRADYLSCYGHRLKTTPNIDKLAEQGNIFTNVISPVPLTLPAHASMLTGTTPLSHGAHDNFSYQLGKDHVTLAEILKDQGFTTGAIVSSFVLDSQFGLDQGFDAYNDDFEENHTILDLISERKGDEATRFALQWLDKHHNDRFFLFLHYYDPHAPYEAPQPFGSKFWENPYAGEIAYTDDCIGQVIAKLKELGLYDSTLIIITGDHGEMLGEHQEQEHSYFVYQAALKVPLVFKLPGQTKAMKIHELVGLIDIVPTVCGLLGIEPPPNAHGKDLSGCFWRNTPPDSQRRLYCESLYPTKYNANNLLAVVTERWKYIQTTRPELYDLAEDPQEMNNLATKQPGQARILQDQLRQMLKEQLHKDDADRSLPMDEKTIRRLASLGYVGGSVNEDFRFDQEKEDPKDLIDFHNSTATLSALVFEKKYAEARNLCRRLLDRLPDYLDGHLKTAEIAIKQGNLVEAIDHYRRAIELDPNRYDLHNTLNSLGAAHFHLGRFDEAIAYYNESLKIKPDWQDVHNNIANAYVRHGDVEQAIHHWTESLRLQPAQPNVLNDVAWVKATSENEEFLDPNNAIRLARQACETTGHQHPQFLGTLAVAHAAAGNFAEAVEIAKRALALAKSSDQKRLIQDVQKCLQLYQAGRPYLQSVPLQDDIGPQSAE